MAIDYEKRDGVAYITLNNPEKANILDKKTSDDISEAWIDLWEDREVRCAILTGKGERHFCGGHNLQPRPELSDEEREMLRAQHVLHQAEVRSAVREAKLAARSTMVSDGLATRTLTPGTFLKEAGGLDTGLAAQFCWISRYRDLPRCCAGGQGTEIFGKNWAARPVPP